MEALLPIIIQIISGAVGGNIAGAVKKLSLGTTANTVAGGIGGVILSQVLPMLDSTAMMNGTVGEIAAGGGGGLILTAIIGAIRNLMKK